MASFFFDAPDLYLPWRNASGMAGYSETPLLKKLGIKPGWKLCALHSPPEYFDWLGAIPDTATVETRLHAELDFIHLFVKDLKTFEKEFLVCKKNLKKGGMLWVSWPKKSSKVPTDLDENIIRDYGLKTGMVDVKVCVVSEVWSGLKFVFRLKDR